MTVCLLGFNPPEFAKSAKNEKLGCSFLDVVMNLKSQNPDGRKPNGPFLITPVYGPETITGSTRMKGGSLTKILLESVFELSLQQAFALPTNFPCDSLRGLFKMLWKVFVDAFLDMDGVQPIVQAAANALRNSGHLVYLSNHSSFGLLGLIDASECVPTFGASWEDVRCFIPGGWTTIDNADGNLTHHGSAFELEPQRFTPSSPDCFVYIDVAGEEMNKEIRNLLERARQVGMMCDFCVCEVCSPTLTRVEHLQYYSDFCDCKAIQTRLSIRSCHNDFHFTHGIFDWNIQFC
jgi:N-acetylmuramic acid 6-phosphate (MurNAc-6-P) etherase